MSHDDLAVREKEGDWHVDLWGHVDDPYDGLIDVILESLP